MEDRCREPDETRERAESTNTVSDYTSRGMVPRVTNFVARGAERLWSHVRGIWAVTGTTPISVMFEKRI
ncbi:hypothetical protein SCP_1402090 [Sparassis crispa]|uniref:Uncharacterized protein n=1 Tax=Sparassis crispa TaxID=139825 RepID=A0A401H321_9APHY|nr:hypothetical protein SCP_1402090 [Sparassis crispa]GBE88804.1 hypothetical protein SCP_1402090 [Sparassis crispa]